MRVNLQDLQLIIKDNDSKIYTLQNELKKFATKTSIKETSGHTELLTENYDFNSNYLELERLMAKNLNLKNILATQNMLAKTEIGLNVIELVMLFPITGPIFILSL